MRGPLRERFEEKLIPEPTSGCWLWMANANHKGYGLFWFGTRLHMAHRVAWFIYRGEMLPTETQLDHLCRTPGCVNPGHLEPVTLQENVRRSRVGQPQRSRTHCPQGHAYDAVNTYVNPRKQRICRTCQRASCAASYAKKRAA